MGKVLKVKIVELFPDPVHQGRTIVRLLIEDGAGEPYRREFSLAPPDRPISAEELMNNLKKRDLSRPIDPFTYIADAAGQTFDVELEPPEDS